MAKDTTTSILGWLLSTLVIYILLSIIQWNWEIDEWAVWARALGIILSIAAGIHIAISDD